MVKASLSLQGVEIGLAQVYRLGGTTGLDFSHGTEKPSEQAHLPRQGFLVAF